jgi:hypothetical protein
MTILTWSDHWKTTSRQYLGLLELHSEIQRHLAREAEKADKWNKI